MIPDFERVSIVWFRPIIQFTYSYAIHEKIAVRAISVFQEKFDVKFTRQAAMIFLYSFA